jgi:hypothetical protein
MLVDVHSHLFRYPEHFSKDFVSQARRARSGVEIDLTVRWEEYHRDALQCDKTIVFGGKAKLAGLWVPDQEVAAYVGGHADKLIGFLSVDPTQPGWQDELHAGFYPNDRKLDYLWEYATRHHLPVLLHTGTTFVAQAPLDCTIPRHLDDVAIRFPHVKIIMAHISHPYEGECVVTIRKHPNVFADCSALHYRPFQLYHSLMLVQEYGVWDKILFGSDYPFTTVAASLDGMRQLNCMLEGTSLPRLDMIKMEQMFQRNTLDILEIEP